jgi:hypothetical protein
MPQEVIKHVEQMDDASYWEYAVESLGDPLNIAVDLTNESEQDATEYLNHVEYNNIGNVENDQIINNMNYADPFHVSVPEVKESKEENLLEDGTHINNESESDKEELTENVIGDNF